MESVENTYTRARDALATAIELKRDIRIALQKGDGCMAAIAWNLLEEALAAASIAMADETRAMKSAKAQKADRRLSFTLPEAPNVRVILVRNPDIPKYVERGIDYGIVGTDQVEESGACVEKIAMLGAGQSELVVATRAEKPIADPEELANTIIATSFPSTVERYLKTNGVCAKEIIPLVGSVEAAGELGADVIIDLTETGATLARNGLEVRWPIARYGAALIAPKRNVSTC